MTPPLEPTIEPRASYSVSKKNLNYSLTNSDTSLTNNSFAVLCQLWVSGGINIASRLWDKKIGTPNTSREYRQNDKPGRAASLAS